MVQVLLQQMRIVLQLVAGTPHRERRQVSCVLHSEEL